MKLYEAMCCNALYTRLPEDALLGLAEIYKISRKGKYVMNRTMLLALSTSIQTHS